MTEPQKEIVSFIPKELTDPRTRTISLAPIKDLLTEREISKEDLIQTYRDEIERLTKELEQTKKSIASHEMIRLFRDKLSMHCFKKSRKITILQCSDSIRNKRCKGCESRIILLGKMEAKTR